MGTRRPPPVNRPPSPRSTEPSSPSPPQSPTESDQHGRPSQSGPGLGRPSQLGQLPGPGRPSQPGQPPGAPGRPSQPGQPPGPGAQGRPSQPGQPPGPSRRPSQVVQPPQQPGQPPPGPTGRPSQIIHPPQQPGGPSQQGRPSQPGQPPGPPRRPSQVVQPPQQPGQPPPGPTGRPSQIIHPPPQPGGPSQQGKPSQPGQAPGPSRRPSQVVQPPQQPGQPPPGPTGRPSQIIHPPPQPGGPSQGQLVQPPPIRKSIQIPGGKPPAEPAPTAGGKQQPPTTTPAPAGKPGGRQTRVTAPTLAMTGAQAVEVENLIIKFNEKLPKCKEIREKYEEQMSEENEHLLNTLKEEITRTQNFIMEQDVLLVVYESLKKFFETVDKLQEESFERQKNTLIEYLEAILETIIIGEEIKAKVKDSAEAQVYNEYVNNFVKASEEQANVFEQQCQMRRVAQPGKRTGKKEDIKVRIEKLLQTYREPPGENKKDTPTFVGGTMMPQLKPLEVHKK